MKSLKALTSLFVAVATMLGFAAQAQTYIYKANNNSALNLTDSWVGGVVPGSTDVAVWDSTVAAANCTNTMGGALTWGGIQISNPAAPVRIVDTAQVLTLNGSGLDLSNATVDCALNTKQVVVAADQTWSIANGRTLTSESNVTVNSFVNLGVNGYLKFTNTFYVGGTLWITNSATRLQEVPTTLGTGSSANDAGGFQVGTVNYSSGATGIVNQTAGTVQLGVASASYATASIGARNNTAGIYNLSGGALVDTNSTVASPRLLIADGSGTLGILNVDGTGYLRVPVLRVGGKGIGVLNVTNGTVLVAANGGSGVELSVGSGSSAGGALNVYGGQVTVVGTTLDVGKGVLDASVSLYGGTINVGTSLTVPGGSGAAPPATATVTVKGGTLSVTNNLALPNAGTAPATVNLDGGTTIVAAVTSPSGTAPMATLNLNGGTLKARAGSTSFIAPSNNLAVYVKGGGAVIDTDYGITIRAKLLDGTGGGGLTKNGSGTLTLSAANTYTGPTIVNAGTLVLTTTNHTGGSIVVSNNAGLQVTYANGATMGCSSLALGTLGASSGGTNFLTFNLGTGNPGVPVINASSLATTGMVAVAVNGLGFSLGTIQLIKYSGSIAGNDFVFTNTFVSGAIGYVTNDTSAKSVNLVITSLPKLLWRAQVNTNWDIVTTLNWVGLTDGLQTSYPDGASVTFDDSATNTLVNLTNTVNPGSVTLNNASSNYVFGGNGRIAGGGGLTKFGAGRVTMALTNTYNGNTIISNGTFVLGVPNAIPGGGGRGNVTLEGKLDLAGFSDAVNGLTGSNGKVDNSSASPVVFSIGGGGGVGVFAGIITNSGSGALALNVASGGTEQLLAVNGYSGTTTNAGILTLASERSISPAALVLNAGALLFTGTSPHTLSNQVTFGGTITLGDNANGLLTIANPVDCGANARTVTCNSDVLLPNGVFNGYVNSKSGPGALTLKNMSPTVTWPAYGGMAITGGKYILDNVQVYKDSDNFRVYGTTADTVVQVVITNGSSFTLANNVSTFFRLGSDASGGDAAGCTNILDLAGTFRLDYVPSPANTGLKFHFGGVNSALDVVNLLPGGLLVARQVIKDSFAGSVTLSVFNFNGGTLQANDSAYANPFLGADHAYVLDGGATIDDGGFANITIAVPLEAGGSGIGGLTKLGGGSLVLAGANTYTGNTLVNAGSLVLRDAGSLASGNIIVAAGATLDVSGVFYELYSGQTLRGKGAVNGAVPVDDGATIAPGDSVSVGTLTFSNAPVLNASSRVLLKLKKTGAVPANDQLAVASAEVLNYNGTLTVTNIGSALVGGETFYLFSAPGGFSGVFAVTNLPPLSGGLSWDTSNLSVNGSIRVAGVSAQPTFASVVLNGTNLVFSGSNGVASHAYYVLASTNIAVPLANWLVIATNSFDASGNFIFTNAINPARPAQFYNLQVP